MKYILMPDNVELEFDGLPSLVDKVIATIKETREKITVVYDNISVINLPSTTMHIDMLDIVYFKKI